MRRSRLLWLIAGIAFTANVWTQAQSLTEADQVEGMSAADTAILYRQSVFYLLQAQLNQLNRLVDDDSATDRASIAAIAGDLHRTAALMPNAFGDYAELGFDIPTTAAASIWQQPDAFADAIDTFFASTQQLLDVTQQAPAADPVTLQTAIQSVARSCKSCHDDFRAK